MVFMEDSERAAELALSSHLDAGLHLNVTEEFTARNAGVNLNTHHHRVASYLNSRRLNQVVYNPFLRTAFEYVIKAQLDEYLRLYGGQPTRIDGHRHYHLCMNILASSALPKKIQLRRNFTFAPGEKDLLNRFYRYLIDGWLCSRFRHTDYFFSLVPIEKHRIKRLISLSKSADVELMTHPGKKQEYQYLLSREWREALQDDAVKSHMGSNRVQ